MSIRFNGLMLTVTPKSTATKLRVLEFARDWVNRVSDADAEMGFFVLIIDTRDSEFGALYSDRLRGDLPGMEDTEYVQMVAPKADINNADDSRDVVEGEDVVLQHEPQLSDAQWTVLIEKALAGDAVMMRIVSLLSESLQYSEALATAVAGVLLPKMLPQVIDRLWDKVGPVIASRLGDLSELNNEGSKAMSDEQIKAAVDAALPGVVSDALVEQLPKLIDDALKRVLPSFLPNWPQLVADQAGSYLGDAQAAMNDIASEYRVKLDEVNERAVSDVEMLAELRQQIDSNRVEAEQAARLADENSLKVSENLTQLTSLQNRLSENIKQDEEQQLSLAELLTNAKQQIQLIMDNQAGISQGAKSAEEFQKWVASVRDSFGVINHFVQNEYDDFKANIEKAGSETELINSIQDTVLKIEGEADRISTAFAAYEKKLIAAEESDQIEQLRGSLEQLSEQVKELGAKGTEVKQVEVVAEPEEEELVDEFADPGML